MLIYLYYTIITILLALVDYVRIRQQAGRVKNINHAVSFLLAAIFCVGIGLLFIRSVWPWVLFVIGCASIRGIFYDAALSLFRGLKIDYTSPTTDAKTDGWMNRFSFWTQRIIYASILAIVLLINYVFI